MIWLTSDLHFYHDRGFIYEPRGFDNVEDMNKTIVEKFNSKVGPDDDVYILGDLMLNNNEGGIELIKSLNGKLHVVWGNHDTNPRLELYKTCPNIVEVVPACYLHYKHYHFFCTHYPCITGNLEKESLQKCTCNLFGHTHQMDNFYQDIPFMYHVGVDSHDCYPVSIDQIIEEMEAKVQECIAQL